LASNVSDVLVEQVKDKYRGYIRAHRQVLAEEFPEHASEERLDQLIAEFEQTADRIAERYYLDEFRKETDRTATYWNRLEPAPLPAQGQPPLDEQLAEYLADWAVLVLADQTEEQLTTGNLPSVDAPQSPVAHTTAKTRLAR
jgi:hypothetical protein